MNMTSILKRANLVVVAKGQRSQYFRLCELYSFHTNTGSTADEKNEL